MNIASYNSTVVTQKNEDSSDETLNLRFDQNAMRCRDMTSRRNSHRVADSFGAADLAVRLARVSICLMPISPATASLRLPTFGAYGCSPTPGANIMTFEAFPASSQRDLDGAGDQTRNRKPACKFSGRARTDGYGYDIDNVCRHEGVCTNA